MEIVLFHDSGELLPYPVIAIAQRVILGLLSVLSTSIP